MAADLETYREYLPVPLLCPLVECYWTSRSSVQNRWRILPGFATMNTMKLGYVILYVPDVAASVAFYEKAFGLRSRFVHESGQYAELETGATVLAFANEETTTSGQGFERCRPGRPAPAFEVALVAEDVGAAYEHAIAAGAVSVAAPTTKPWGQEVSYVRDADGFLVEICSAIG